MRLNKNEIYFDNAASAKPYKILKKLSPYFYADSTSYYQAAIRSKAKIEQSRIGIANLLNVAPACLRFTSNGTEANNLAINLIQNNFNAIITSKYEHPSVLEPLKIKAQNQNIPLLYVKTLPDTTIDLKHLKSLLKENEKSFVSLSQVNMFTGRLLQISRVTDLCHKYNSILHSDMSLTIGKLDIDLNKPDVDIATASSHKLGSYSGAGLIYFKRQINISPIIYGSKNEFTLRPGRENIFAIYSMFKALEYFNTNISSIKKHILKLKRTLQKELNKEKIIYESPSFSEQHFLPDINILSFPQIDNFKKFILSLDLKNIYIHPLEKNIFSNTIRISFAYSNTEKEVKKFVKILKNILHEK